MSWLLVVQPDSVQADVLRKALYSEISEHVVVAQELEHALSLLDRHIPDVILLPTLISASVEDHLIAYVGAIPGARHVQILGLPHLEHSEESFEQQTHSRFPWRRPRPRTVLTLDCEPAVFARDVITYLAGAKALKAESDLHSAQAALSARPERRREPRFANHEVPWISIVRLGSERAVLINVSTRGALLRIHTRPDYAFLRRSDPDARPRPHVTLELESNREIHAIGRVVRCIPVRARAQIQYDVAFAFDESVGLHLPAAGGLVHPSPDKKK